MAIINKAFIDEIELNNYIEKLKCLVNMQNDNVNILDKQFNSLLQNYNTTNTNEFYQKKEQTLTELSSLQLNSSKYIDVIEKTIIKYHLLVKNTSQKFENIID